MEHTISVIVPVYNVARYLRKCVESILGQSHADLELILIDDGSKDRSGAICQEYATKDPRVRVIRQENGGVSAARNAGLAIARGKYIGFVDGDDWIESDMYKTLLQKMEEQGADIVQCGYCTDEGEQSGFWPGVREARLLTPEECLRALICGDMRFSSLCNKLYRAELFRGKALSSRYKCFEDARLNYQVMKASKGVYLHEVCGYHYVRHPESALSRLEPWRMEQILSFYSELMEWEAGGALYPYCEKGLVDSCFSLIGGIVREKSCREQYPVLRKMILDHREKVLHDEIYTGKDRMKLRLLWHCPPAYDLLIRVQRVARRLR